VSPEIEACPNCGARHAAEDVFCERCGNRLREDLARHSRGHERTAQDAGLVAGVSDRGLVRRRNEDALFVRSGGGRAVAVVCDGVSSAVAADVAARVAARTVGGLLEDGVDGDGPDAMVAAVGAAQRAVRSIPWAPGPDRHAPSCTLVAALDDGVQITLCSIGDSRAYWVTDGGVELLTRDDSWCSEQVDAGLMSEEEAARDERAHMITGWLGADAPDRPLDIHTLGLDRPGRLVLCTDGLWNFLPGTVEIDALVRDLGPGLSPLALAHALADFAVGAGGHDNVTVAVLDVIGNPTDAMEGP
jgi:serine/threonine protein phosphatase PrpC